MSKKPLPTAAGFGSTLGDLLKARGVAPPESARATPAAAPPPPPVVTDPLDLSRVARVVVRRESKGRAGKTVTIVSGLPIEHLEALCKAMKAQMGCGAAVEGEDVVLQGDQSARTEPWLTARGVRRVVRGN
jgi:translation initiation factor 1